ncbi:Bax inhibitor-1/YccA family protein [Brucella thiophenivorans]|uniref:Inhibitor of apoptosis-promoting Bax1 family protein n=1 Tax=Brucella thiophenivorans TaxID=571255 RepID=A0A256FYM6_9HYPH|nr:Bax inhibitor-1/YccA family protein [Brucella thiophenivorans]OYR19886.1 inhibitor of apoptosis-promoting Bax1 family protein [Brucella thiophenivorans]
MADFRNIQAQQRPVGGARAGADIDQGLRSYMLGVYNMMAIGLVVTGLAALAVASLATTTDPSAAVAQMSNGKMLTALGAALYTSPLRWVVMLAPLAAVFFLSFRIERLSVGTANAVFWGYAALVGLSLSSIFLVFTGQSIVRTFFVTAASFGALSLYGYTTKRDLSAMGSFLMMGLFGLIIASVVNIFLGSTALQFAISVIGVLIFAGLTAYDTQSIKEMYFEGDSSETQGRKVVMGALRLYLDFINMFMFLLQFMGNRD